MVPKNWIVTCNNKDSLVVKWPPILNVTSDIILAAMDPLPEWQSFNIKLLDDGKEYCKLFYNSLLKYSIYRMIH